MVPSEGAHFDFFVEASAEIGMGHLSRAASLINQLSSQGKSSNLHLFGDSLGRLFAQKRGLAYGVSHGQSQASVAIIDAVSFRPDVLKKIASYPVRVVISPSFRSLEIATHYLARSTPISGVLQDATYVDINEDYAFVSSMSDSAEKPNRKSMSLGICLTAGQSSTSFQLAELLLASPSISEIRVISSTRPPQSLRAQSRLILQGQTLDPWGFFSTCDRFIGGDGLMVSEAVAMHKSTFSLVTDLASPKNIGLISKGAILPFTWKDAVSGRLSKCVTDEKVIRNLRNASERAFSKGKAQQLAHSINALAVDYHSKKGVLWK